MNELHLFAGAGGGILGGMLLGHTTVCAVEIEPYCRRVLLQRQRDGILPRFPIWDDIRTFDGTPWRGRIDVVCGGFPCQDISIAGKGAGIDGERSGLWSEMARVIREVGPRFVFVENSPALASRGFGRVLGDLAEMGYDCRWGCVSAEDAIWLGGTPAVDHRRERMWILGKHADCQGLGWNEGGLSERACEKQPVTRFSVPVSADAGRIEGEQRSDASVQRGRKIKAEQIGLGSGCDVSPNPARIQQGRQEQRTERERTGEGSEPVAQGADSYEVPIRREQPGGTDSQGWVGQDERSTGSLRHGNNWWITEPDVGRVAHELAADMDSGGTNGNGDVR